MRDLKHCIKVSDLSRNAYHTQTNGHDNHFCYLQLKCNFATLSQPLLKVLNSELWEV